MKKLKAISIIFFVATMFYPKFNVAQTKSAISINLDYGLTMMIFKDFGAKQALHLAPNISKRNHEFYLGPILILPSGGLFIGANAGYKYHIIHDLGKIDLYVYYDFIYYQEKHLASAMYSYDLNTYKYNFGHHSVGLGFNITLDKNNRFSINNSLGFIETLARYKPSQIFSNITSRNYGYAVGFSLGFIYRIKSWEKKIKN